MLEIYHATRRSDGQPVEFPVEWEDPEDAKLAWPWASDHFPLPATPLAGDLVRDMVGMTRSYAHYGGRTRIKYIHHHGYGFGPHAFLPPDGETREFEENVAAQAPFVTPLWTETWWPLIEREARQVREADYSNLSLPQLVDTLIECRARYDDHYELMMRASRLVRPPRTALQQFLNHHFPENSEELTNGLLSGTPNISLQASGELWEIGQMLQGRDDLVAALEDRETLLRLPGGAAVWKAFSAWLDQHGHRNSTFEEVAEPSWFEDPSVPLAILRGHAAGTGDPRTGQRAAMAEREELQQTLEARLGEPALVAELRRLVELALPYAGVRESRPYASCISRAALRYPALALGRSLVAHGLTSAPDDVFFLRLEELQSIAANPSAAPVRELVANRRRAHESWRSVIPPLSIGAASSRGATSPLIGEGIGASKGAARGKARVVLDLKDAGSFQPGEVLVTVSTSPLWTALFGLAAAVVTESGGMLSHSSIVAREHRIPAVVGLRDATRKIRTGDTLLVNGTAGKVEVLG